MKLTKTVVQRLESPGKGYRIVRDSELKGFSVRITAAGVKTFVFERRINGKVRRIKIARYPDMTVEQARKEAESLAGKIASGRDPIAEKKQQAARDATLREAMEAYLEANNRIKERTRRDVRYTLAKESAEWLDRPLVAITREVVAKQHKKIGQRAPAMANKWARFLSVIFNYAMAAYTDGEGKPYIVDNPVSRLSHTKGWYRIERRQTVIKARDLSPWMQAVQALAETPERGPGEGKHRPKMRRGEVTRDYFLFVLLTGLRKNEALNLKWSEVDFDEKTITISETKAHRTHTLPLSDYLTEMLERRQGQHSEYVFADEKGRLSNLRYAIDRVRAQSGVQFKIHDLRRTFATIAESLDIPAYALKRLLNHAPTTDVTAGYLIVDTERLRKPMQKITDYMLAAGGLRHSAEVIELADMASASQSG